MIINRFNDSGEYTCRVETIEAGLEYENRSRIYIGEVDFVSMYHDIATDKPMLKPPRPSDNHTFNYVEKRWEDIRTLQECKDARWLLIKVARGTATDAGFVWNDLTFDSDEVSQQRITGAVSLAQISESFSINWTLADNSTTELNAQQMISVGVAAGQHVATQFAIGQSLRALIDQATTKEEVEAISWPTE